MAYKTGNPALNSNTFKDLPATSGATMTLEGATNKTFILLALLVAGAVFGWNYLLRAAETNSGSVTLWLFGAIGVAFILSLVIIFRKTSAPAVAPVYAIIEGFAVGAISAIYEQAYGGIVRMAISLTVAIFVAMLLIYKFRIIRATENFKLAVASATGGVALFYLVNLGFTTFGGHSLSLFSGNGTGPIIISLIIILIASLNLVMDFDFIETGARDNAPGYMEWYGAFGLLVTLVWLYLEILRLLAKRR